MHMERSRILYVRNKPLNNFVFIKSNTTMFNFDYVTNEGIKGHNPKWPEIPDHPY